MYECVKRMLNDLFARAERELRDELPEGSVSAMASRRIRALRKSTADAGLEWDGHTAILNDLAAAFDGKYFAQYRCFTDAGAFRQYVSRDVFGTTDAIT